MISARSIAISTFWVVLSVNSIHGQDLSAYREFNFGMNLPAIAKQAGLGPAEAKVIHRRPALIQELNWYPVFSLSSSPQADPVWNTVFSFYNGELFRIVVNYNRRKTEGLTAEDMIESLSAKYGPPTKLTGDTTFSLSGISNDIEEVIARWEDSQYSFSLFRSSYGPAFGMLGLSKRLDPLAQTAIIEAVRIEKQEAPQREIERQSKQGEEDRLAQEKARLANKPKFRP